MSVFALLSRGLGRLAMPVALLLAMAAGALAQPIELPHCHDRPTAIIHEIYVDNVRWCLEHVAHEPQLETLAFTALAVAPDGALYAARPLAGSVMRIVDTDGDALPDAMETYASGLSLPNGLAYHEGALFVAGGGFVYRITADRQVEIIVDNLPHGSGFGSGGLAIGADDRLYLAMGAPCSLCQYEAGERGAILSMELDGSDRRVMANGLRNPADLAFFRGRLWTVDSAPSQSQGNALDELNRVDSGHWYGFPYCLGRDTVGIFSPERNCQDSREPVMLFGSGAKPSSLAAYPHDVLPGTKDSLIVVLRGEPSQVDLVGYKVIMITFDEADQPLGAAVLIPFRHQFGLHAYLPYDGEGLYWERFIHLNERGFGMYPQQPLAVAVSPEGWIYISVTGGRIIALRPRYDQTDYERFYAPWTPMHPRFDPALAPPAGNE